MESWARSLVVGRLDAGVAEVENAVVQFGLGSCKSGLL